MVWATNLNPNYNMTPRKRIYRLIYKPFCRVIGSKQREFIVNVLFFSLALFTCLKLLSSTIHYQPVLFDQEEDALVANGILLFIVLGLWHFSRRRGQVHRLRVMELQRFAEFGRLNANLLHDIANPLTAASLNLENYGNQHSLPVIQARKNLQQLKRYLEAARQQLKTEGTLSNFSVQDELQQIVRTMTPLAQRAGVKLRIEQSGNYKLYGDSVKFNQLVANLITNAIDAYANTPPTINAKHVAVTVNQSGRWLKLQVTDWGKGINALEFPQLFEPFYTTKYQTDHDLGIGLSIVKQYVTADFGGSIKVSSSHRRGTKFTVKLRYRPFEQHAFHRQYRFRQIISQGDIVKMLTARISLSSILFMNIISKIHITK